MLSIQYAIESELRFPAYPNPNDQTYTFNWVQFYNDHDSKTINVIEQELNF